MQEANRPAAQEDEDIECEGESILLRTLLQQDKANAKAGENKCKSYCKITCNHYN